MIKENKVRLLEEEIKYHDKLYWEKNQPKISDVHYDNLIQRLTELDPKNPLLNKIHPSTQISSGKVQHKIPMLSLNKVYTKEDLIKWCEKIARDEQELFLIEYKFDGISADFTNGILSTRGDGNTGEDITDKLPLINKNNGNYRGEIIFYKSFFEENKQILKKKDGEFYSNARNACAGILNRDDLITDKQLLTFIPFNHVSQMESMKDLRDLDFEILKETAKTSMYPTDGLVIKLADEKYKKSLGSTSHHARGEIALKFANNTVETKLLDVIWSCGKEVITPVGKVDPVEIGGVTISNISLHNALFIQDNDICIGDTITIERAGDVIPHFVSRIHNEDLKFIEIFECPECGAATKYEEPNIKCTNPECSGALLNRFYSSVQHIGIDRLGKPTLRDIMNDLGVEDLRGLFSLKVKDFMILPRFAERKSENLYDEIQKVLREGVYERQILASVNIPGIGKTLSTVLCERFGLMPLIDMCVYPTDIISVLCEIDGIEEKRANDIYHGIVDNHIYITDLWNMLPLKKYAAVENIELPTICLSGKFPEKKAFYYVELIGKYEVVEKVTKDLDILVVADTSKNSGKQQKAKKLNIEILSIDDLIELVLNWGKN